MRNILRALIFLSPLCLYSLETSVLGSLSWELSQIARQFSPILAHSIAESTYGWAKIGEKCPQAPSETNPKLRLEGAIEGRGGYFYFANSTARNIYHQGTPDVELESFFLVHRYFNPWINANYVWKEGHSEALSERTDLRMGMFSFGSKIMFPYRHSTVKGYIGFGLCGAYMHITDHSAYLPHKTVRWGGGVVGKSGMLIDIKRGIFLDLFFDYYYLPIKARSSVPEHFLNLGGLHTGLGIGSRF